MKTQRDNTSKTGRASFDLVIRGGMVIDGSGAQRYRADVAINDGRIARIGKVYERGDQEIDADGLFVTPGFIDGHTHLDAQVNWDPYGPSASHGVTTVVMGNCGFSLAPCREADKELIFSIFERAEDVARESLHQGVDWRWDTFSTYLDHLRVVPKGINYAAQVGHSALRAYVMGEDCFDRSATDDEIAAMATELRSALFAGAIGMSSSRSKSHFTSDDRPVPSRGASWDELVVLLDVLHRCDQGVFQINLQDEPDDRDAQANEQRLRSAIAAWALESGRPCLPLLGRTQVDVRAAYDDANERGARIFTHWNAKEFDSVTGFRVRLGFDTLPGWQAMRRRPLEEQRSILADPAQRGALVHEAMTSRAGSETGAEARHPEYDILQIMGPGLGPFTTVAQVAAERCVTPVDAIIDLSIESDFHQLFSQSIQTFHPTYDEYLERARDPHSVWGVSDAGAHLAQSVAYDNSTYFLGHWVREEEAFTWEEGIRMLTAEPAFVWGFRDRGLVHVGYAADLLVVDPEQLSLAGPSVANDLPGGAVRLKQEGVGYKHTIVNGQEVLRDNQPTGALPGVVLQGCGRD